MNIRFILVEPKVPENIGASARAIKTMGFNSLVLVNPCPWKEGKSKWVAHGSSEILDNALVFNSLDDALADSDFAIATSARKRTVKQDNVPAGDLRQFLKLKSGSVKTVSVIFGREESGLTNSEMQLCDITSSIPMAKPYPSLNLSQAVMLFAYELSGIEAVQGKKSGTKESSSFNAMKRKVGDTLKVIGVDENDNRYGRIMERISFLDDDDIHLVHSLCSLIREKFDE